MQFCVHERGSQQCLLNAMETQNPLCCLTFPRTEPQDRPGRRSCRFVFHVAAPRGVSPASAIRHVGEEESATRVVRVRVCLTEPVVDPMVSDRMEDRVL